MSISGYQTAFTILTRKAEKTSSIFLTRTYLLTEKADNIHLQSTHGQDNIEQRQKREHNNPYHTVAITLYHHRPIRKGIYPDLRYSEKNQHDNRPERQYL